MTRSDLTHLYFLLDRSGSMQSTQTDTAGGFNAFKRPGTVIVAIMTDGHENISRE